MADCCITEFLFRRSGEEVSPERHHHNINQIIYLTKGQLRLDAAGASNLCTAPCLVLIPWLAPHAIVRVGAGYERFLLSIDPRRAAAQIAETRLLSVFSASRPDVCPCLPLGDAAGEIDTVFRILYAEFLRGRDEPESSRVENERIWLSALLQRIFRLAPELFPAGQTPMERIVASVRDALQNEPAVKLNLPALAARHFVSPYYLSHSFRRLTGCSMQEYHQLCRLSAARELLETTAEPIAQIANETGFCDASNFTRSFRETFGVPPTGYRATARKERS